MGTKPRLTFIGGDRRQQEVISLMVEKGYMINTLGWKGLKHDNILDFQGLSSGLFNCQVLVLPIPYRDNDGNITGLDTAVKLEMLLKNLKPGTMVIYGKEDQAFLKTAEAYPLYYHDILKVESFAVLNAIPTAEGAIQRAMERTDFTLHGANTLVLGYGRIGKVLSRMLNGIGSHVTVMARKSEDLAWIAERGYKAIFPDELDYVLGSQDIVFNTIPSMVLDRAKLSKIRSECIVIDLASHPGGVDFPAAKDLGIMASHDLALPSIVAPKSAAKILCQVIEEIISSHYLHNNLGGDGLVAKG